MTHKVVALGFPIELEFGSVVFCEGRKTAWKPDLRGNVDSCLYEVRDDLQISSKERDIGTQAQLKYGTYFLTSDVDFQRSIKLNFELF